MKAHLVSLVSHASWANMRTLSSLRTLQAPPEEAVRLFAHIVTTEDIYLNRMRGRDPFPQDFWPPLSMADAEAIMRSSAAALRAFVGERSEEELIRSVRYRNSKGTPFETPLNQMLTHLALHGEHHRGQVARLVREAGGVPAVTDFITFTREESDAF